MAYVTVTRLYHDAALAAGAGIALGEAETHYLRNVLRLAPGARIALFNGRDGEWWAEIESLGRRDGAVRLLEQRRAPRPEPDLWLCFAPLKRARIDYLVEKATELGVCELRPVFTDRTVVERLNLDRLRAHIREAAEQTERLSLPVIHEAENLSGLVAAWPGDRALLLCDETGTAPPILDVLAARRPGPWAVLVGPEGGFSDSELDALRRLPFLCAVSLGPRVLRADTAALAALAVLQASLGDWRIGRGA
ncbi:MAG: 16S rRNA (uracil(1498)-N(3))-methyltransferase [Stellaceae bacterium]